MMTLDEKIKTVLEYYQQATDKDNPLRTTLFIDDYMRGRMVNSIQSFDLMDNKKYREIDELLVIMKETFGYNVELQGMIKSSLREADFMLAKRSIEIRHMLDQKGQPVNFNADELSIKSADPLIRDNTDVWNQKGNLSRNQSGKFGEPDSAKIMNKTMDN